MPNTLVHLCVQTPVSRLAIPGADFKWIALGCIIPDIPWILQRIITPAFPGVDTIDLRIYSVIQASLFFSLVLSLSLSLLSSRPARIFFLLAGNVFLHLLLDALQVKWGNGVHFLAPFSWRMTNISLFWPEELFIFILSMIGLGILVVSGLKARRIPVRWTAKKRNRVAAAVLLVGYCIVPLGFFNGPMGENNHYVATISGQEARKGKKIEIDRRQYRSSDRTIHVFSGERLFLQGEVPRHDALLSVRGYFTDGDTVRVTALHEHTYFRDLASIVGLAGILVIWLFANIGKKGTLQSRS